VSTPDVQQRIYLRVNKDATEALLETDTDYPDALPFDLKGETALSALRDGLTEELTAFREMVPENPVSFPEAEQALNKLRNLGTELASQFFGGSAQVDAAQRFFHEAVPNWRTSDGSDLTFVYHAPMGAMFPVELLPIFAYSDEWKVTDTASLAAAARNLLGFGAVVARLVRRFPSRTADRPGAAHRPGTADQIRLRMFHDLSLDGAKLEASVFSQTPLLQLDGPWPVVIGRNDSGTRLAETIARTTLDSAQQFNVKATIDPDQYAHFVHFACHGYTSTPAARDYTIRIQGQRGGARQVSLGDLKSQMAQQYQHIPPGRLELPRPVVVMNSCGSARLDPRTAVSFPELFLTERFDGFIGPEARIPDEVASAFSRQFYTTLTKSRSVGQALHRAKWTLLSRWSNPLGILWAAYIDPDYQPMT
jgi:CHAT domain